MENDHFQNDVTTASSPPRVIQPDRPQVRGFSKRDWADLKPIIRNFYLDQGQTLEQLAKYLEENHGFKPTKKQLTYRISGWGFEKNVKKDERRELIQKLSRELQNPDYLPQNLRGRIIDKEKLNRWMRQENMEGEPSPVGIDEEVPATNEDARWPAPEEISGIENRTAVEARAENLDLVSSLRNEQHSFDWSCVDVLGSPRLSRLIGALTIEEYGLSDDITSLNLASDTLEDVDISGMDLMDLCTGSDWHTDEEDPSHLTRIATPANTPRFIKLLEAWTQPSLQFELYPFPTSTKPRFNFRQYFSSRISLQRLSESECLIKFRKLKHLQDVEISNLVDRMGNIACDMYNSRDYATAESWYRRVVTAKQRIKWLKPEQTLCSCVQISNCMLLQGRYSEVQQLHKYFHAKIEQILGCEHPVSSYSRILKGDILRALGLLVESDGVYREVLQIFLSSLGVNHPNTLAALDSLGLNMVALRRSAEVQSLYETIVNFRYRRMKASGKFGDFEIGVLRAMNMIAEGLNMDMKYDESERVLDCAQKLLGKTTSICCPEAHHYHYQRAYTYQLQGRLNEGETILRGLVRYHANSLLPNLESAVFRQLAYILVQTGRMDEEAYWLKRSYLSIRKAYGLLHEYTMKECETLGLYYSNQRRYDKARLFFASVIEAMTSSTEDPTSRMKCIQEVNTWMLEVEEMRLAASMTGILEPEDFEVVDLGMDENIDWEGMRDVPDPLS